MEKPKFLKIFFLLAGSFTFAFLLGEMVHEWGHFLAHRYFAVEGVSIHLDPFGGSRILGVRALPLREMGITTAAGPGLNLAAGIFVTALLWKFTHPALMPLILWGPVAMIQEGVNLSLGLASPGSDAQWLAQWGAPHALLILLGVAFILGGTGLISWILKRSKVLDERTFAGRSILVFFGLGFLMILRALVSTTQSPEAALENWIPLIFALILTGLISGAHNLWREDDYQSGQIFTWTNSLLAIGLGLGMLAFQIVVP